MSDFWSRMFDNEVRQRTDIDSLRAEADDAFARTVDNSQSLQRAHRRIEKLELMLEATWHVLKSRLDVTDAELSLMVARVDLADGREDGRIGRPRANAPTCHACGRPRNPKRGRCVFCHAVAQAPTPKVAPPVRTTACSRCSTVVPERSVYFAEDGMVCEPCFSGRGDDGGLTVAEEEPGEGGLELTSGAGSGALTAKE